jgi:hypothetical protein
LRGRTGGYGGNPRFPCAHARPLPGCWSRPPWRRVAAAPPTAATTGRRRSGGPTRPPPAGCSSRASTCPPATGPDRPTRTTTGRAIWVEAALARCLHVSKGFVDPDNPKATSPTFSTADDGTEITSEVTVTPSPAVAGRKLDLFQAEAAPGCYEKAFRQEFARQASGLPFVELGDTAVDRLDVADLGDETVAYRLTQRLSERGQKVSLYYAVLLVRVGRIGITTTFVTQGEPFDRGEAADITRVVADRARAA